MADSGTFKIPPLLRLVKPEDTDPDTFEPEPEWVKAIGMIRNALNDSFYRITWERQYLFKRAMQKLYRMKAKGLQHPDVLNALILLSEEGYEP